MLFDLTEGGPVFRILGMARDQAGEVLRAWGEPAPFRRGNQSTDGWIVQRDRGAIFASCDETAHVDALEFANPGHGTPTEDRVLFANVDLFTEPALTVVRRL